LVKSGKGRYRLVSPLPPRVPRSQRLLAAELVTTTATAGRRVSGLGGIWDGIPTGGIGDNED
jgi:hypothetical protein